MAGWLGSTGGLETGVFLQACNIKAEMMLKNRTCLISLVLGCLIT
jgi:hypothetical protein